MINSYLLRSTLILLFTYTFLQNQLSTYGACLGSSAFAWASLDGKNFPWQWANPGPPTAPETIPVIMTCDSAYVWGHAGSCIPGTTSVTLDVGNTGCESEVIESDAVIGGKITRIFNCKKSGVVKLTAKVSAPDCADREAIATIEVIGEEESNCESCSGGGTNGGSTGHSSGGSIGGSPGSSGGMSGGANGGGTGSSGGGSTSGGENPTQPQSAFGSSETKVSSLSFRMSLGKLTSLQNAGKLELYADIPSVGLSTPSGLKLPFTRTGVDVLPTGQTMQQIKVPDGLVKIATINSYEYEIRCFYASQITGQSSGLYTTTGNPFVTYVIKNPDGATAYNKLWITEKRSGSTDRVHKFTYTSSSSRWDLLLPDGETTHSKWPAASSRGSNFKDEFTQVTKGSTVVKKVRELWETRPSLNDRVLLEEEIGESPTTRVTTNTYYGGSTPQSAKLKRKDYFDGNWKYYKYDSKGRVTHEYSSYRNGAPPSSLGTEPDVATGNCKLVEYSYSLNYTDDNIEDTGGENPIMPLRTIVKLPFYTGSTYQMKEVAREYTRITGVGESETQWCPEPGLKWNDTSNVREVSKIYFAADGFKAGRPSYIAHRNGTITAWDYTLSTLDGTVTVVKTEGSVSSIVNPWADDLDGTAVIQGTKTTTIYDSVGRISSEVTEAIQPSLGAGFNLVSNTYYYLSSDPLGKSYRVVGITGRTNEYQYECCGLSKVIDDEGGETVFLYDDQKRLKDTIKKEGSDDGLKLTRIYDPLNRVIMLIRIGTNGVDKTTNYQASYNVLGLVESSTNAMWGKTTYAEAVAASPAVPHLIRTKTNSDSSTEITDYYRDGRIEKVTGSSVAPMKIEYGVEQDGSLFREFEKTTMLTSSGGTTSEWKKKYKDGLGRVYKTVYSASSGTPTEEVSYNNFGHAWKTKDPDGVYTLYKYNAEGEVEFILNPVDAPSNYEALTYENFDPSFYQTGANRLTKMTSMYVAAASGRPNLVRKSISKWKENNVEALVQETEVSANGLSLWNKSYCDSSNLTESSQVTTFNGSVKQIQTYKPDGTSIVESFLHKRLQGITTRDSNNSEVTKESYQYDSHWRVKSIDDLRNGIATIGYNFADQVTTNTTSAPGTGRAAQTTVKLFNSNLLLEKTIYPDGTVLTNEYHIGGLLKRSYGSRQYPIGYGYNDQRRLTSMTNWVGFSVSGSGIGARVTTWGYDDYRGWLDEKSYPNATTGAASSTGINYEYTPTGKVKRKKWARLGALSSRIAIKYTYNIAADSSAIYDGTLKSITYENDTFGTPSNTYTYDRFGRQKSVTRDGKKTEYEYDYSGHPISESYFVGTTLTNKVTWFSDDEGRVEDVTLYDGSLNALLENSYTYNEAGFINQVDNTLYKGVYSYHPNSTLVKSLTFQTSGGTTKMVTSREYDKLQRLTRINSVTSLGSVLPQGYAYTYNDVNQREAVELSEGTAWKFKYDKLGQVVSGKKSWKDGTFVPGSQFEYAYDDIGNRTFTKTGGDSTGDTTQLRGANYEVNGLNQIDKRDIPNAIDVAGLADASSTVSINGSSAGVFKKGQFFYKQVTVNNTVSDQWFPVSLTTSGGGSSGTKYHFVPLTKETNTFDLDGNILTDGRWNFTWDSENRLVSIASQNGYPTGSGRSAVYSYDDRGRRISKMVYLNGSSGPSVVEKYIYDNWNLIAIQDGNGVIQTSFQWGNDLSGSFQGAGGIGGLISMRIHSGALAGTYFYNYDGNGNVTGLVSASSMTFVANYEYGPFGELLRMTGSLSRINPFRFSSKFQDDETDFLYYGYRYYNPSTGSWLNRDPLEERGGLNLYGMLLNDTINKTDYLGLEPCQECGVKKLALNIVGYTQTFVSVQSESGIEHPGFNFNMFATVEYKDGGGYVAACCLTIQKVKSTVKINGIPYKENGSGTPLDGEWHNDSPNYQNDEINIADAIPSLTDYPGVHGLRDGMSFVKDAEFQLITYDMCNGSKVVKRSNISKFHASGIWPHGSFTYSN